MRYLALVIAFALNLFGANECNSCHQEQTKYMTSECTTCHVDTQPHLKDNLQKTSPVTLTNYQKFYNDDRPIIRSYQGKMQTSYGSSQYFHMQGDVHFQKGMICQDCHSSKELHSDGFWQAKQASKIKCQDCHGTIEKYPWEMENSSEIKAKREGDSLLFHLASGKVIELKPLKLLKRSDALSKAACIAMKNIEAHSKNLECSSCHATWAPQFYGSALTYKEMKNKKQKVEKESLFVRWEEPFLMQNKDGKISPAVPKTPLKTILTDAKGNSTIEQGENLLQPFAPHTIQKKARSCESCHTSSKVLNGTIDSGVFQDKNITHFNLSKVLSEKQRDKLDRRGVCLSCHDTIPNGNLAISTVSHITQMVTIGIDEKQHQTILKRILNMSAWFQIILVLFVVLILIYIIYTTVIKKRSINPRNRGWK
ncbi:cytochrome c3 family protein [Sulfurimonas marina]|uniref:Cytochrome C n=1 Tax=Sulfurimonas marina TaxID=2590551 RepID=A0A7M1ASX6_9BACT|nr:cytochrome c3 family protein [Sulfurimonas marina]QOP40521.1 hypothetical protein FJR03_01690 [Sulfurimonas marina]